MDSGGSARAQLDEQIRHFIFEFSHDGFALPEEEAGEYDLVYVVPYDEKQLRDWIELQPAIYSLHTDLELPADLGRWKQLRGLHSRRLQLTEYALDGLQLSSLTWVTPKVSLPPKLLR